MSNDALGESGPAGPLGAPDAIGGEAARALRSVWGLCQPRDAF